MRFYCLCLALLTVTPAYGWLPRSCAGKLQALSHGLPDSLFSPAELAEFETKFRNSTFPYKEASRAVFDSYQEKRRALLSTKERVVLHDALQSRYALYQDVISDRSLVGPPFGYHAEFNYDRNKMYVQVPKAFEGTPIDYLLQAHEGEHALQLNSVKGTWGFFVFASICRHHIGDGRPGTLKWMSLTEFGALKGEYLYLSGFPHWVIDEYAEVIRTQFTADGNSERNARDLLNSKRGFGEFLNQTERYRVH